MGYQYRCSRDDCRARVTLKRKIEDYVREKKCPGCGRSHTLRPVYAKERARTKSRMCRCGGYPWPHRHGTEPFCGYSTRQPTDQEWLDFNDKLKHKYGGM